MIILEGLTAVHRSKECFWKLYSKPGTNGIVFSEVFFSSSGNLTNCAKTTLKAEGPLAFYKGAIPRMATQGPLFGIALLAFEIQKW